MSTTTPEPYLPPLAVPLARRQTYTIAQVCHLFLRGFAERHYSANHRAGMRIVARILTCTYGHVPIRQFRPRMLRRIQAAMVQRGGFCRSTINFRCRQIKRLLAWAASAELCPVEVVQAIRTVPGLRFRDTKAPESPGIVPVS